MRTTMAPLAAAGGIEGIYIERHGDIAHSGHFAFARLALSQDPGPHHRSVAARGRPGRGVHDAGDRRHSANRIERRSSSTSR